MGTKEGLTTQDIAYLTTGRSLPGGLGRLHVSGYIGNAAVLRSSGGGGVGMYYFFSKDVDILSGPVWFNDRGINGDWKWTTQLDINFAPWLQK